MNKFVTISILTIIIMFKNETAPIEYKYKNVWAAGEILYLYDEYDDKKRKFIGNYEAFKLEDVKSYKNIETGSK